ncbi:MAG: rod-binding protein [Eubacteriales bacterium]|nr:rod-binding protein [Eubacteriales bacterium]
MNLNEITRLGNINYSELQQINKFKDSEAKADSFSKVLDDAIENKDDKKLKKACVEFESYFLNMMFKSMRQTIVSGTEKSNAEKMFQEMLDQEMCQNIAETGGIGFADMMYKQLSKEI